MPDPVVVTLVFLLAGTVKGVLGMGLPTVAMGLLGLAMPLPQAAALLTLPSFVTNVWQAAAGPAWREVLRRLWLLQVGIVAGAVLAAALLPRGQDALGHQLLGACLLAYGLSGLAAWRLRAPAPGWQPAAGAFVGVLTGILTALTGVYVLPAVPYLQALNLERRAQAQGLGLCFTTSTAALAAALAVHGDLGVHGSIASALALLPALAGMALGQRLRNALSERAFRLCFFAGLAALGAWTLATAR